jgi:ribonuclease BN (tRNA processing enzyme)
VHDVPLEEFEIEGVRIKADLVLHPGLTLGYRLSENGVALAYLSDHEPALGGAKLPDSVSWTSGYALAEGADVLIHDSQYTDAEYEVRQGWGHSSFRQAVAFAKSVGTKKLVTFHPDPSHSDKELDALHRDGVHDVDLNFDLVSGCEGLSVEVE